MERRRDGRFGWGSQLGGRNRWGLDGRQAPLRGTGAGLTGRLEMGDDERQGGDDGGGRFMVWRYVLWLVWRAWQRLVAVLEEGEQDTGVLGGVMLLNDGLDEHLRLQDGRKR